MKKVAHLIRIITISPIMVTMFLLYMYFGNQNLDINTHSYIIAICCLIILPVLAYPIQKIFKPIKIGDARKSERILAIIFSIVGYIIGFILSFILKSHNYEKIFYLTYLFSGIFIALFSFVFKINASGHMAGVVGPTLIIMYLFNSHFYLITIIVLVFISSLIKKRHNVVELLLGSLIPIASFFISLLIFIK